MTRTTPKTFVSNSDRIRSAVISAAPGTTFPSMRISMPALFHQHVQSAVGFDGLRRRGDGRVVG